MYCCDVVCVAELPEFRLKYMEQCTDWCGYNHVTRCSVLGLQDICRQESDSCTYLDLRKIITESLLTIDESS